MSNEGVEVKRRRERIGMTITDLSKQAGVNRDTVSAIELGQGYRADSLGKVKAALDRLEEEMGIAGDAEDSSGGVEIVRLSIGDAAVQGPVRNLAELEATLERLVRLSRDAGSQE